MPGARYGHCCPTRKYNSADQRRAERRAGRYSSAAPARRRVYINLSHRRENPLKNAEAAYEVTQSGGISAARGGWNSREGEVATVRGRNSPPAPRGKALGLHLLFRRAARPAGPTGAGGGGGGGG